MVSSGGWRSRGYYVLPLLLGSFPQEAQRVKETLLFILFNEHPVAMSQRMADYAVSAVLHTCGEESPVDANSMVLGHLILKPKFDALGKAVREERRPKASMGIHTEPS